MKKNVYFNSPPPAREAATLCLFNTWRFLIQTPTADKLKAAIAQKYPTIDKIFEISQDVKKTDTFVARLQKVIEPLRTLKTAFAMVAKAAVFLYAVYQVVDTIFGIIDGLQGRTVGDTYEYNDTDGQTYYWNGGSHNEHKYSILGFSFSTPDTDIVDASAMQWLPITRVVSQTSSPYYSMGQRFATYDDMKQEFIRRILSGEYSVWLGYRVTLLDTAGNRKVIESATFEALARDLIVYASSPIFSNYLFHPQLTAEGKLIVTPGVKISENAATVMSYIKPIWVAQLPMLQGSELKLIDFRLPVNAATPLYPAAANIDDGLNRKYYLYDPNVKHYEVLARPFAALNDTQVRQSFIEKFKTDFTIQSKYVLKADLYHISKFDDIPLLLYSEVDQTGVPLPHKLFKAKDNYGNSEVFLDEVSAMSWLLSRMDFQAHLLGVDGTIYSYENMQFLSIAEFVRYVLTESKAAKLKASTEGSQ